MMKANHLALFVLIGSLVICGCAGKPEAAQPERIEFDSPEQSDSEEPSASLEADAGRREAAHDGREEDIRLDPGARPLTETLQQTMDELRSARRELSRLAERNRELEFELARKDAELERFNEELLKRDERVKSLEEALEQWKRDVLGFRDEMRHADEAQMEALKQIIILLRGFERVAVGGGGGGTIDE